MDVSTVLINTYFIIIIIIIIVVVVVVVIIIIIIIIITGTNIQEGGNAVTGRNLYAHDEHE